jgi:acetyl-CoA acetyltransferase
MRLARVETRRGWRRWRRGCRKRVAGLSIDRQCAGGLDALLLGAALIRAGQHDIVVAGGVESYSRRPAAAAHLCRWPPARGL